MEGIRGNNLARRDDDALLVITASAGKQIIELAGQTVVLRPGAVVITEYPANGDLRHPRPPDQTNHQSAHDGARLVRYR